jgi:hypothetical protein
MKGSVMHFVPRMIIAILVAVSRARLPILTIGLTYAVFIVLGIVMVHTGNTFALTYRDQLVSEAVQHNPASIAANQGDNVRAALWDFAGNLVLGALPKTISGMGIIFPYPPVAYQGWVGGIVSVRGDHTSRLSDPRSALYYLLTLLLQVIPYSLGIGAGVNVGIALFRPPVAYQGAKWLNLFPKEAVRDLLRIYILVVGLFLMASFWEFLSPWNL